MVNCKQQTRIYSTSIFFQTATFFIMVPKNSKCDKSQQSFFISSIFEIILFRCWP